MQLPLQVTFHGMPASLALDADIREKAAKLDTFYDRIMSCHVTVEAAHHHHTNGNVYAVRIDLTVPGNELVVSRGRGANHAHEDAYVAVRDAFNAVRRQLESFARRQRGDVKEHAVPPHGRVLRIRSDEDYGIILSADQREIYFHRNSVLHNGFDALEPGTEVRFSEEAGEQGPQASVVHPVGKHHVVA